MENKRTNIKPFKLGDVVIIGYGAFQHNEYSGFTAKVEYCKTCCKDYRLQMLEWGNNVNMSRCDIKKLYKIELA